MPEVLSSHYKVKKINAFNKMFKKLTSLELGRPSGDEYRRIGKMPVVVVLDNIRSQHNIGSAFRTSDAFLVEKIVLCGICAVPPSSEIHKSALGAEFSVEWSYREKSVEAIEELRSAGYIIIGVEQVSGSKELGEVVMEGDKKYALVFGNEVKGVSQEVIDMCDLCIEIPQWGTKHSLNVSVTMGIVLWDFMSNLLKQNI